MTPDPASHGEISFEQLAVQNGGVYWLATSLMAELGYETWGSFRNVVNRAIGICMSLGISMEENFVQTTTSLPGETVRDFKLSRFACYLTTMNADVRKPQVAHLQAYLAALADAARAYVEAARDVERVQIRDDVSERERGLNSAAKQAGVENYAFFQNEGYRGMYNMNLGQLKEIKGMAGTRRSVLDFMGKRELAGNLFRLTETEERLKNTGGRGQRLAEVIAHDVGRKVRGLMTEDGGTPPELELPAQDIKEVRQGLKQTAKSLKKIDGPADLPPHA